MSRHTANGRKAAENRPASRLKGPAGAALGALVLAAAQAPGLANDAAAQSRSGIYINNDVLNNLGPGPDAAPLTPLSPTPLTPGGPAPSYQYEAPGYAFPAPRPLAPQFNSGGGGSSGGLTFQTYGSGNFVVTRPGTLLFPPLEAPSSTLTPGFNGIDNQAARAEALNNAFAGGPEPSSQLLIPLDNGGATSVAGASNGGVSNGSGSSVIVNLDALPSVDPYATADSAPRLTLIQPPMQPPQPAPRKPAVPVAMLAEIELAPVDSGPSDLAPEFMAPAPTEVAELPAPEPQVTETMEPSVDETPEPVVADAPAAEAPPASTPTPASNLASAEAPAAGEPVSSAQVPAPVALAETPAASGADTPVSLLPAARPTLPEPAASPAPAGLQTASLTVEGVGDMTFLFEVDSAELSAEVQTELRSLADTMSTNEEWIQVLGFASDPAGGADQARKLALSRALKVRSFLIDAGIASARIQVRSLGDRTEGGPANRVDIKPIGS